MLALHVFIFAFTTGTVYRDVEIISQAKCRNTIRNVRPGSSLPIPLSGVGRLHKRFVVVRQHTALSIGQGRSISDMFATSSSAHAACGYFGRTTVSTVANIVYDVYLVPKKTQEEAIDIGSKVKKSFVIGDSGIQ